MLAISATLLLLFGTLVLGMTPLFPTFLSGDLLLVALVLIVVVPVALFFGSGGWTAWRQRRQGPQETVRERLPDSLAIDTHGVAFRCGGRATLRYSWSEVRRLDAGAGQEKGWLRLWLVDGVPLPDAVPDSRRTSEGALLVLEFGDGAERETVAAAVRAYRPPGVRMRL
ncbi:hypothetical protein AN216_15085 [Streptomyces oceani]|uniref:Uncharacterized protein n=1 Tax=Streptomyces oceani TaxID=1075402 RepID=A0A1E7KFY5_9ACTN|nr:hypothetical protein AN216_15085 [Streptomyces oceani]